MKPIIVYASPDESGNIILTKEELSEMISNAYEQGKADTTPFYPYGTPKGFPNVVNVPLVVGDRTTGTHPDDYTISTCGSENLTIIDGSQLGTQRTIHG